MNDKEFVLVTKVIEMRKAQKKYFALRTQSALIDSKRLEKDVDLLCETLLREYTIKEPAGPTQEELL